MAKRLTRAKARTPEEIRDLVRAEVPALVAMHKRFVGFLEELNRTSEYRHWSAHYEDDGWDDSEEALRWEGVTNLCAALAELTGDSSPKGVLHFLRRATNPKAWTIDAARADRDRIRRRQARSEAKSQAEERRRAAREASDKETADYLRREINDLLGGARGA